MRDVPAANLYFLWSLERVCVLYDVPAFGDKDWYRWGAEAVVANQSPQGDWLEGGGYPGATPTANTCLALLFLARTNLVSDLTAALKLNQDDLTKAITVKVAAPAPTTPPPPPTVVAPPPAPITPPVAKEPPTPTTPPAPAPTPAVSQPVMPTPPTVPAAKKEESGGGGMLLPVLLIVLAVVLLLAAGGAVLVLNLRKPKKEIKSLAKGKQKKGGGKSPGKPAPDDQPVAKKPPGKKGIRT